MTAGHWTDGPVLRAERCKYTSVFEDVCVVLGLRGFRWLPSQGRFLLGVSLTSLAREDAHPDRDAASHPGLPRRQSRRSSRPASAALPPARAAVRGAGVAAAAERDADERELLGALVQPVGGPLFVGGAARGQPQLHAAVLRVPPGRVGRAEREDGRHRPHLLLHRQRRCVAAPDPGPHGTRYPTLRSERGMGGWMEGPGSRSSPRGRVATALEALYGMSAADVTLYVNNTGLMWENAAKFGAVLVFAEHRCVARPCGREGFAGEDATLRMGTSRASLDSSAATSARACRSGRRRRRTCSTCRRSRRSRTTRPWSRR